MNVLLKELQHRELFIFYGNAENYRRDKFRYYFFLNIYRTSFLRLSLNTDKTEQ